MRVARMSMVVPGGVIARLPAVAVLMTMPARMIMSSAGGRMIGAVPRLTHARYCTRARPAAAPFLTVIGHFDTPTPRSN
jgi:hypothetical protein